MGYVSPPVCPKKCAKRAESLPLMGTLMHDFDRRKVVSLTATEQVAVSVFHSVSPVTNGAISAYALRLANGSSVIQRPCHLASGS
jgi:hypothetical protein